MPNGEFIEHAGRMGERDKEFFASEEGKRFSAKCHDLWMRSLEIRISKGLYTPEDPAVFEKEKREVAEWREQKNAEEAAKKAEEEKKAREEAEFEALLKEEQEKEAREEAEFEALLKEEQEKQR